MTATQVQIEGLSAFLDSLSRQAMKDHERRFADRIKLVKEASLGLANTAARIATGVKNAWGTLDKTTSEYGMRLADLIHDNASDLARKETAPTYPETEEFHENAVEVLNTIITTVRKYIPKLPKTLRAELAALNGALARLENSVRALGTALDESPGLKLDSLRRDVQTLMERHKQLLRLQLEERQGNTALDSASQREETLLLEKEKLSSEPEFLELKRYEESLTSKEGQMKLLLQPLAKPLLKLERAASTRQGSTIDFRILRGLIEQPVDTVLTGQSFAIAELMGVLDDSLSRGELDVEERKRRRAEETIRAVKDGALQKIRDEFLAIQANTQETLRQLKAKGLVEKRDSLDNLLAETRSQIEALKGRERELHRRMTELTSSILKEKATIESRISKIAHESVDIVVA